MRAVYALLLAGGALWIAGPILPGLIWALVLGCAAWPLVRGRQTRYRGWLALGLTVGAAAVLMVPLTLLGLHAAHGWQLLLMQYRAASASGWPMPDALSTLHLDWLDALWAKTAHALPEAVDVHGDAWLHTLALHAEAVVLNAAVALLVLFAALREGAALTEMIERQVQRTFGQAAVTAVMAGARAVRAMFWSIALVSIAEAVLLSAVFLVAGIPHPLGFGSLAGLTSIIPLVTLLVVLGAAAWLTMQHAVGWAVAVAAIGVTLSFVSDHLIRPLCIGRMAGLPVVLALLAMIAGALSLGIVGLFLGPGLAAGGLALLRAP